MKNPYIQASALNEAELLDPRDLRDLVLIQGRNEDLFRRSAEMERELAKIEREDRWRAVRGPLIALTAVVALVGVFMSLEVNRAQRDTDEMTQIIEHTQSYAAKGEAAASAARAAGRQTDK